MDKRQQFIQHLDRDPVEAYRVLHIRLMMLQRRLPRTLVANEANVSPSYLSRVLHGKTRASVELLNRLDDAIHVLTHEGRERE